MQHVPLVHIAHGHCELSQPHFDDDAVIALAYVPMMPDVRLQSAACRVFKQHAQCRRRSALHERPVEAHDVGVIQSRTVVHLERKW